MTALVSQQTTIFPAVTTGRGAAFAGTSKLSWCEHSYDDSFVSCDWPELLGLSPLCPHQ